MQSLAIHELGHLLGLAHVEEGVDPVSVMNPSLFIGEGLTARKLSRGDITRIQTIYGCEGSACDIDSLIEQQEYEEYDTLSLTAKQWLDEGTKVPVKSLENTKKFLSLPPFQIEMGVVFFISFQIAESPRRSKNKSLYIMNAGRTH